MQTLLVCPGIVYAESEKVFHTEWLSANFIINKSCQSFYSILIKKHETAFGRTL